MTRKIQVDNVSTQQFSATAEHVGKYVKASLHLHETATSDFITATM